MQAKLETNIQYLKGVGPKIAERLKRLGVETVSDLLSYFPRDWADYTKISKIADLEPGNTATIKGQILNISNKRTRRRRFAVTEAVVADDTGTLKIVWFNQPYLGKMLKSGREIILNGKVSFSSYSGDLIMESPNRADKPTIVPIYPETKGISSYYIQKLVSSIIGLVNMTEEYLPPQIITKYQLLPIKETIKNLHQPGSSHQLFQARRRMAFDELFLFSLQKQLAKRKVLLQKAPKIAIDEEFLRDFSQKLPFELTPAQKKSAWSIIKDLNSERPMNRLLNGDVGSGKTVVAAMAAALVVRSGMRVALMAPTEILALQHYTTLKSILPIFSISVGLVTGGKKENIEADVVVGTHALISGKTSQENLGLVIIDEQHRFGVDQRNKLLHGKGKLRPHFLSMTATPIPRTMSLVIFADLDISVIDQMPKNRKKIITKVVAGSRRQATYNFINREIEEGHQVFVICPLIEAGEDNKSQLFEEERKTVTREYDKLSKEIFPNCRILMLHGKMKSKEKEAIMSDFKAKKYDILVSTSVVEVGVDIPNATVMVIEDAQQFGLAQLHQFRGRVGRSNLQSYCFLFSSAVSENAKKRLSYMEKIDSGFELAEKDLELRGPGQIYGSVQSGFWDFRFASIGDKILIEDATEAAKEIVPKVGSYPLLLKELAKTNNSMHME